MKPVDFSGMIVLYNLVIGILIMLSSEKIASFTGFMNGRRGARVARLTRISAFTFGASVSIISAAVYVGVHMLRIGI